MSPGWLRGGHRFGESTVSSGRLQLGVPRRSLEDGGPRPSQRDREVAVFKNSKKNNNTVECRLGHTVMQGPLYYDVSIDSTSHESLLSLCFGGF